jgi:hypothetical protein
MCEVIEDTIVTLQTDRLTFSRFRDGVMASEAVMRTHFPHTIARWYSQSVLLGLRRLADDSRGCRSLRRLMERMIANPQDWSLNAVVELQGGKTHRWGEDSLRSLLAETSYKFAADASGEHLDTAKIEVEILRLDAAVKKARDVVDKTIAHRDRNVDPNLQMTFAELHDAVFECEEIAKPYTGLITGAGYGAERGSMTPYENHAWFRIFEPWRDLGLRSFKSSDDSSALVRSEESL